MPESVNKPKVPVLLIQQPVDVQLIKAHMAGSLGVEKAEALVMQTLTALAFPTAGVLPAEQAEVLLTKLATEAGIVGLAARVTKQMVRNNIAPLAPR